MDGYGKIYPLTNPWLATTSSLAAAGWLIAFIGACVEALHGVVWWIIIYELFFVVGTFVALGLGAFGPNRGMLLAFLAISIVYLTFAIPIALNTHSSGGRAVSAGLIIMIITQGFWIFLLGCSEESPIYNFFYNSIFGFGRGGGGGGFSSSNAPTMTQRNFAPQHHHHHQHQASSTGVVAGGQNSSPIPHAHKQHQKFPVATALHSYQANPEDPTELSFSKGEELDILDHKGNWWQAKKQDGSTGIIPSNYVRLA
ncbi:hypothetical protein BX666DRAFT_1952328 [Dichotomocladium elegans]|nr:hypothetical protein BX666DRAFT_1952328 [Dichotomocladium elegans]